MTSMLALLTAAVSPTALQDSGGSPATEGPTAVGPIHWTEHLPWFLVLSLFVFLIYNGLRQESVADAFRTGLRRWLSFLLATLVLALISGLLAQYL